MMNHPSLALVMVGVVLLVAAGVLYMLRAGVLYFFGYVGFGLFGGLALLAALIIAVLPRRRP